MHTFNLILAILGMFMNFNYMLAKANPSLDFSKLNKLFDVVSKHEKAMGRAVIFKGGKLIFERSYGFKNQQPGSLFRIGSVTKTYTAAIVIRLIEEGILKFDTKLSEFYQGFPNGDKITIEHLLRHRSGLVNFTNLPDYPSFAESQTTEKEQLSRFSNAGISFEPGLKYEYSNTGYVLLTYIAQKAAKKSFQKLLTEYILIPLKLSNTYIFDKKSPRKNEVSSYDKDIAWKISTNTHQTVPEGAGAIVSKPTEVAIFFNALLNGNIVNSANLAKMKTIVEGYGLGLQKVPYKSNFGFGHTGGIDGFRSIALHFDKENIVLVHLANAAALNLNDLNIALVASAYGDDFDIPQFRSVVSVPVNTLKKYEGTFGSSSFPLIISFFVRNSVLYAQGDGQPFFTLESYSTTEFGNPQININIEFKTDGGSLELTQGGVSSILSRIK